MINDSALAYWKNTRYSSDDISRVCKQIDNSFLAARVDFQGDGTLTVTMTKRVDETKEGHLPACVRFLRELIGLWNCSSIRGSVILWLEDGLWDAECIFSRQAPILAFGKKSSDYQTLLMPDPAFLFSQGYLLDREEIQDIESSLSWSEKKPTLFWRGAASGFEVQGDNWLNAPRVRLPCISKEMAEPSKLDAAISLVKNLPSKHLIERIEKCGITADYLPFSEFLKYRYLVDIDGFCCAWKSLYLKLASHSTVVKVQSDYIQWFADRLFPWIHYVPLRSDYSDLNHILHWLSEHDSEAQQISSNARNLIKEIDYYDASKAMAQLLPQLFEYQRL